MGKKIIFYSFIIILLPVMIGFLIPLPSENTPVPIQITYSELYPTDLVNNLTVRGTVESVKKNNVYTSLGFRIKEVKAQMGDTVLEGQVLCILDIEDLELTIEQLKAELDISQKSSLNQYENNKRIYQQAAANLMADTNTQVLAAENALKTAQVNLENAQRTYSDAYNDYINNNDSQVKTARVNLENAQRNYDEAYSDSINKTGANITAAESSVASAKLDLDVKYSTYINKQTLYEKGIIIEEEFKQTENLYKDSQNRYDDALKNLENAKTAQTRALDQLENTLNAARTNYDNAVTAQVRSLEQAQNSLATASTAYDNAYAAYSSTTVSANQDLDAYESNLKNSEIALNKDPMLINIRKLEKQLDDSVIKSPVSGTVTAVFAKEGSVASGLLFVVEDTENLQISCMIKEYDYSKVEVGMDVIIRSDSTGGEEYPGLINKIDPAAAKNSLGEPLSKSDVEFGMIVDIIPDETKLRIGMNTRLEIVLDKKSNVFCVRFEAVTENEKGENIVFVAEELDNGEYQIRPITVTIGMETDYNLEIASENLRDGMKIISDSSVVINAIESLNKTTDGIGDVRFTLN